MTSGSGGVSASLGAIPLGEISKQGLERVLGTLGPPRSGCVAVLCTHRVLVVWQEYGQRAGAADCSSMLTATILLISAVSQS